MDNHDVVIIIFSSVVSVVGVLAGFIMKGQSDAIKSLWKDNNGLKERIGKLEVAQGEIKTDLRYIRDSIESIKNWIQNGQKGPL